GVRHHPRPRLRAHHRRRPAGCHPGGSRGDRRLPRHSRGRGVSLTEPVLELVGVRAAYGPIEVLHGVDLSVPAGAVVALLGPNGAGKTTTLNVCCGLHAPASGELRLAGRAVTGAPAAVLARRGVCSIPERRRLFPALTVAED